MDIPAEYSDLIRQMGALYDNPLMAFSSWAHLACLGHHIDTRGQPVRPNRARALWELRHRPHIFGSFIRPMAPEMIDEITDAARETELPAYDPLDGYRMPTNPSSKNTQSAEAQRHGFSKRDVWKALTSVCRISEWLKDQPWGEARSENIRKMLLGDIQVARYLSQNSGKGSDANTRRAEPVAKNREAQSIKSAELECLFQVPNQSVENAAEKSIKRKVGRSKKESGIDR